MMGPETEKHYKNLFKFYRELDTWRMNDRQQKI
jgi:hypothetical protein